MGLREARRLWLVVALAAAAGATLAAGRRVCATCFPGPGLKGCRIAAGYGVNCVYLPVTAQDNTCVSSAAEVFGAGFDVRNYITSRGLVAVAMLSTNTSSVRTAGTLVQRLSACRAAINLAQPGSSWPALANGVLLIWQGGACGGSAQWPTDAPFRVASDPSVAACARSALSGNGASTRMLLNGGQHPFQQAGRVFDCKQRYMFSADLAQVSGPQSSTAGGMTPGRFVAQCGKNADYDLYVPPFPSPLAACGQDGGDCMDPTPKPTKPPHPTRQPHKTKPPTRKPPTPGVQFG